eukprot:CAMPEP_0182434568 /NCGR_PEP_ID=MMETSP1167-20130531/70463_1 /TAXON_ID=2988 /ORGANISM="Mallomonas Sp, Strain CCMP3275" /LENGTH=42 /DNA_ID= /DNA_START= /DNA_END= /DNA_ORIENTATION=
MSTLALMWMRVRCPPAYMKVMGEVMKYPALSSLPSSRYLVGR